MLFTCRFAAPPHCQFATIYPMTRALTLERAGHHTPGSVVLDYTDANYGPHARRATCATPATPLPVEPHLTWVSNWISSSCGFLLVLPHLHGCLYTLLRPCCPFRDYLPVLRCVPDAVPYLHTGRYLLAHLPHRHSHLRLPPTRIPFCRPRPAAVLPGIQCWPSWRLYSSSPLHSGRRRARHYISQRGQTRLRRPGNRAIARPLMASLSYLSWRDICHIISRHSLVKHQNRHLISISAPYQSTLAYGARVCTAPHALLRFAAIRFHL